MKASSGPTSARPSTPPEGVLGGTSIQKLVIDGWLPWALSNGSHGHWATRQRKLDLAQKQVWAYAKAYKLQPVVGRARLTITLVFPQHRRRDTDNLYSRVKGCVDGLVKGGWLTDDSADVLELVVRGETQRGEKRTEIELEQLV